MTPPLPPLQEFVDRCGRGTAWMRELIELEIESYARLAVREALERAARECSRLDDEGVSGRSLDMPRVTYAAQIDDCIFAIRAMIEEYSK